MPPKPTTPRGRGRGKGRGRGQTRRNLETPVGPATPGQHPPTPEQSSQPSATASGADFAREFLNTLHGYMQQQTTPQQGQGQSQATPKTNDVVEQFRRFSPPKFRGKESPEATEEWVEEMERIFGHLECTESQKVSCATFQLIEDAGHWWKS